VGEEKDFAGKMGDGLNPIWGDSEDVKIGNSMRGICPRTIKKKQKCHLLFVKPRANEAKRVQGQKVAIESGEAKDSVYINFKGEGKE